MLHTKPQDHWPFGSGEEVFESFLTYMGVAAILVMWPRPREQTFVPPSHWGSKWNIAQDQDQDSLLVKRRNDNHSQGPVIRELVPSSHQRSELSNTILCIFSGWDQRIGEGIPIPDSLGEEATFINVCIGNGSLKCHRVLIPTTPSFGDKVICWYTGFTFKTFI